MGECIRTSASGKKYRDNLISLAKDSGSKLQPVIQQHCPACMNWHAMTIEDTSVVMVPRAIDSSPPKSVEEIDRYFPKRRDNPRVATLNHSDQEDLS